MSHRVVETDRTRLAAAGTVALLLVSSSSLLAQGEKKKTVEAKPESMSKEEVAERYTFITKAMEEHSERVKERRAEMARLGFAAIMSVASLKPFADWDYYYVEGVGLSWSPNPGQPYKEVVVPRGFVTDLASIPRLFWQALTPQGRYAFAAVVHDYLYWTQIRPRTEADDIFRMAMEDSKVDSVTTEALYQAVSSPFGQAAWNNNAALRRAGERRVLKRFPTAFTTSWSDWKKEPDVFQD